jgi:hypothetical protein
MANITQNHSLEVRIIRFLHLVYRPEFVILGDGVSEIGTVRDF